MADDYFYTQHFEKSVRTEARTRKFRSAIRSVSPLVFLNGGDGDIDLVRRNLADGTRLRVVGAPTCNAGYTRTTGALHYLRSTILEHATFSFSVFGRRSDTSADNATIGAFFGSFAGGADPSALLYWHTFDSGSGNATLRGQVSQGVNVAVPCSETVAGSHLWKRYRMEVVRSGVSGTVKVFNDTDTTVEEVAVTAVADLGRLPMNFGASRSGVFGGHIEWNHMSYIPGIPTGQEWADHWDQVLAVAEDQGVTENT